MNYTKRYSKRNLRLTAKLSPPPRLYPPLKQRKTVLGMVASMTADQFMRLTQFQPSPELAEKVAAELIALRERFLQYIQKNAATHKEWKTEFDAWTDYLIGEGRVIETKLHVREILAATKEQTA